MEVKRLSGNMNDKQKNPGEDHIITEPDVFERKTLDEAYQDA